jgi:hypothetical protein
MDICVGVYFSQTVWNLRVILIFALSIKTELGSAGEQPMRDIIDGRQKCHSMGYLGIAH